VGQARLVVANAGDHAPIHTLLRAVNQSPTYQDFISWLDEPSYQPTDRMLVKDSGQIVAHVQVLHRVAMFADVKVPVGGLQDFAVLPELVPLNYDRLLLEAAEHAMQERRAVVSIVRSSQPERIREAGWTEARGRGYSQANVGDLLAHLAGQNPSGRRRDRGVRIRLWRHVELDSVRAIYRVANSHSWGAMSRSEKYWQWLVGRKAHSELIVAVEGHDDWEDLSTESRIVGYAVTHGSQVVEVCCRPKYAWVAPRLLERACRDAIERDYHAISLHTSAEDPLHELMVTAGGSWSADDRGAGGTLLVKLLDAPRWIETLDAVLRCRTRAAGIPRPCELGFDVGGRRCRLVLTRRRSRLVDEEPARVDVSCSPREFSNLLLGNLHVGRARDAGRIEVSGDDVLPRLAVLFPPCLFWQSQFDALRM
jgi:ribosomal protein S18 acetylase RimI-like enzyme